MASKGSRNGKLRDVIIKTALSRGYVTPAMIWRRHPYSYQSVIQELQRLVKEGLLLKLDRGIYIPNCIAFLGGRCADGSVGDS